MEEQITTYGGFWRRAAAFMIDAIVMTPLILFDFWALKQSASVYIFVSLFVAVCMTAYKIYFHGRWGATLGKKAMALKVLTSDVGTISYKQAAMREIITIVAAVIGYMWNYTALSHAPADFATWTLVQKTQFMGAGKPALVHLVTTFLYIILLIDPLVLLFNARKRTIHDFIADTVVIKVPPLQVIFTP